MKNSDGPVGEIQRGILWLGGATVLLFLVVVGLAVTGWFMLGRQIDRNDTARKFNCIQRAEVDHRIALSKNLLKKHPEAKILHLGGLTLTRSFVKANLLRDQGTRRNMNILDC